MEVTRELTLAFEGDVKKVILSNPVDNTIEYKKIEILPSTVKGKTCYQVCRYTKTQVFQKKCFARTAACGCTDVFPARI